MLSKMKNSLELFGIIYHLVNIHLGILSCQCHIFLTKQHIFINFQDVRSGYRTQVQPNIYNLY